MQVTYRSTYLRNQTINKKPDENFPSQHVNILNSGNHFISKDSSVAVRHLVDADPDIHLDANPDPDLLWNQNDADPQADPTSNFTHFGK
jgi:hypothetical protein